MPCYRLARPCYSRTHRLCIAPLLLECCHMRVPTALRVACQRDRRCKVTACGNVVTDGSGLSGMVDPIASWLVYVVSATAFIQPRCRASRLCQGYVYHYPRRDVRATSVMAGRSRSALPARDFRARLACATGIHQGTQAWDCPLHVPAKPLGPRLQTILATSINHGRAHITRVSPPQLQLFHPVFHDSPIMPHPVHPPPTAQFSIFSANLHHYAPNCNFSAFYLFTNPLFYGIYMRVRYILHHNYRFLHRFVIFYHAQGGSR
jgi:hypothetical protein